MAQDVNYLQQLLNVLNSGVVREERVESEQRDESRLFSSAVSTLLTNGLRAYINYNYGSQPQSSFLETFFSYYSYSNDSNEDNEDNEENKENNVANEYRGVVTRIENLEPGENRVCSICLEDFTKDSQITITPCKHEYHLSCMEQWYHRNQSCPVCRSRV
jgi:hypothetical protein